MLRNVTVLVSVETIDSSTAHPGSELVAQKVVHGRLLAPADPNADHQHRPQIVATMAASNGGIGNAQVDEVAAE